MEMNPLNLLDEVAAAKFLNVSRKTLQAWRFYKKIGPPYVKLGRCVRYRVEDLRKWLDDSTVKPEK